MYELMAVSVRERLRPHNLAIYRFQIPQDEEISFLSRKLREEKQIFATFTNMGTITMIIPKYGDKPVPITRKEDLQQYTSVNITELAKRLNLNDSGHGSTD